MLLITDTIGLSQKFVDLDLIISIFNYLLK